MKPTTVRPEVLRAIEHIQSLEDGRCVINPGEAFLLDGVLVQRHAEEEGPVEFDVDATSYHGEPPYDLWRVREPDQPLHVMAPTHVGNVRSALAAIARARKFGPGTYFLCYASGNLFEFDI